MLRVLTAFLLLPASFCAAQSSGTPDSSRYEIAIGLGISTNTSLKESRYGSSSQNRWLVSPALTVHAFRRLSARVAVGLRAEATQWRSEYRYQVPVLDANSPTSQAAGLPGSQPGRDEVATYHLGRAALSLAPCIRWSFGAGPGTLTAGAYAGVAAITGPDRLTFSNSGNEFDVYYQRSYGFAGGLEVGYNRALGKRMAVGVQGALQYVRIGQNSYSVSCFAVPVTLGLSRTFR